VRIAILERLLIDDRVRQRVLPILRAMGDESLMHVLVEQRVEVINVERLIPVLVNVISPIKLSLNYPPAVFPAQDGRFSGYDVVLEQAAEKPMALIIGDQVGIRIIPVRHLSEDCPLCVG